MILFAVYLSLAVGVSFLCSILEAVLLSVTPTFLNVKQKEGAAWATNLIKLKEDVDRPLIAILTLNTIAHTVGAMGVGEQTQAAFGTSSWVAYVIPAFVTFLILVGSEIIPKTFGATYWKSLAAFSSRALNVIMWPLRITGLIFLMQLITKMIGKSEHGSILSKGDISMMAEIGEKEGVLQKDESTIIKNLMRFKNITVEDVMTPRTVLITAPDHISIKQFYESMKEMRFSRIPIYEGKIDNVTGYILKDELFKCMIDGKEEEPLKSIARPLTVTKEAEPIPDLFNRLMEQREHIAMVVDNYGGIQGIVTQEDIIETLLGTEIMDEMDNVEDMQKLAREKWEKRAKKMGLIE